MLVAHFSRDQPRELRFTEGALAALSDAQWPGHVRQLRNTIDRLAVLYSDDPITEQTVARELGRTTIRSEFAQLARSFIAAGSDDRLDMMERLLIEEALRMSNGNHSEAARMLGVHRKRVARVVSRMSSVDDEDD
jgi:DNA-binding NtrC family response regulator